MACAVLLPWVLLVSELGCWIEFGIRVGTLAGGLLGLCGLSTFVYLAGSCN